MEQAAPVGILGEDEKAGRVGPGVGATGALSPNLREAQSGR
jgi:hypothetical protein